MRSSLVLSAFAVAVSSLEWNISQPLKQWADEIIPHYAPEITVAEEGKAYVVKLECVGCPFAIRKENAEIEWQEPPKENALVRREMESYQLHTDNMTAATVPDQVVPQFQPLAISQWPPPLPSRPNATQHQCLSSTLRHYRR